MSSRGSEERREAHRTDIWVLLCLSTSLRMIFFSLLSEVEDMIRWILSSAMDFLIRGLWCISDFWPKIWSFWINKIDSLALVLDISKEGIPVCIAGKGKTLNLHSDYDTQSWSGSSFFYVILFNFTFLFRKLFICDLCACLIAY